MASRDQNPSGCVPAASLLLQGLYQESSQFKYFLLAFLSQSSRVKECSDEFDTTRGILKSLMKSRTFQWHWESEEFELVHATDLESHSNSTGTNSFAEPSTGQVLVQALSKVHVGGACHW